MCCNQKQFISFEQTESESLARQFTSGLHSLSFISDFLKWEFASKW